MTVLDAPETGAVRLRDHYAPVAPQVGILAIGGALAANDDEVRTVLAEAGHTVLRRFAQVQPRPGEDSVRVEDIHEFLDLYGHEYALVVLREGGPGVTTEAARIAASRGCRLLWESESGFRVTDSSG